MTVPLFGSGVCCGRRVRVLYCVVFCVLLYSVLYCVVFCVVLCSTVSCVVSVGPCLRLDGVVPYSRVVTVLVFAGWTVGGLPCGAGVQYFSEVQALAIGGHASGTGGPSLPFDYAPVWMGYQNCQVGQLFAAAALVPWLLHCRT